MLVDSHCHLDHLIPGPGPNSPDDFISAARARGVSGFLSVGVTLESSRQLLRLPSRYPDVVVSVGAHPLQKEAQPLPEVEELARLASHNGVVAVGETGLDNHYGAETAAWQQESFVRHLQAAKRVAKPVIVHSRQARNETLELIRSHGDRESGGVLHCFTENWEMARAAIELNFYISFSGIITFRNAADLREVVRKVPLERLLVETDSPWLAPVPYRGKQNQPAFVVEVAEAVAELKGIDLAELARITTGNFNRLFKQPFDQTRHCAHLPCRSAAV
jgi:TatD DNase family protein